MRANWCPRLTSPSTSTSRISTATPTCWKCSSAACAASWTRKAPSNPSRRYVDADIALPSRAPTATTNNPVPPRRPLSLAARAAIATGFALAAFLGIVGLTLSQAQYRAARSSLQDRLQNFVIAYLAGTEVTRYGKVLPPDSPPDPNFMRPGSGLYAMALGEHGYHWESSSAIGRDFHFLKPLQPGESQFVGPVDTRMGRLYYYSYGVAFDSSDNRSVKLTFMVAQT